MINAGQHIATSPRLSYFSGFAWQALLGIQHRLVFLAIGVSIALSYAKLTHAPLAFGLINGITVTVLISIFETFLRDSQIGNRIRCVRFVYYLLLTTGVWACLILLSLEGVTHFFSRLGIESGDPLRHRIQWVLLADIVFAICAAFMVNFLVRVTILVGGKTIVRLVLGRYHRPLREHKVFLFIDLVDSTRITQQLGNERVQTMFAEFFADVDIPVRRTAGETHRYVGDAVIVTWPLNEADKAIEAVKGIGRLVSRRANYYKARYGVVPTFRAGIHGGEIVSSEVGGRRKREIVFFGDAINTAARLTDLAKERSVDVLVSGDIVEKLKIRYSMLQPLGHFQLKGRGERLCVYELNL